MGSALSMGTVNFGLKISEEQAFAHLDLYAELGGNLLDSAHVDSDWIPGERSRSERIIGRWMKSRRPGKERYGDPHRVLLQPGAAGGMHARVRLSAPVSNRKAGNDFLRKPFPILF